MGRGFIKILDHVINVDEIRGILPLAQGHRAIELGILYKNVENPNYIWFNYIDFVGDYNPEYEQIQPVVTRLDRECERLKDFLLHDTIVTNIEDRKFFKTINLKKTDEQHLQTI